ncbi:hypothetical protein FJTKL_12564 [Diaporthe vaccinii]|uniref:Uncharacterized protein n=1 Tax=Diaporthe vaccinii TaxID=105482 RepID=A0ABR4ED10_9PEZI
MHLYLLVCEAHPVSVTVPASSPYPAGIASSLNRPRHVESPALIVHSEALNQAVDPYLPALYEAKSCPK